MECVYVICDSCNQSCALSEVLTYHGLCEDCWVGESRAMTEHTYRFVPEDMRYLSVVSSDSFFRE